MGIMSVRIDDKQRRALKIIASIEGRPMGGIVAELIESYIDEKKSVLTHLSESDNLKAVMKMSESAFSEWDNCEDDIFNTL